MTKSWAGGGRNSEDGKAPEKVAIELTPKDGKEPAMERANRRESEVEIGGWGYGLHCLPQKVC